MSTVVSQVVFHPVASQTLKMWSKTVGRDKTYRAAQYLSRLIAWLLVLRGHKLQAARFTALKSHLATARKLMRLGKPMEHLQVALRATQTLGDTSEQITTIGKQLGYFGYLAYDAVVWAHTVKFIRLKQDKIQHVSRVSNRFWLAGILFSITHGILKLRRLAAEVNQLNSPSRSTNQVADREVKLRALEASQAVARRQFFIDSLDIWIPATNLGFANCNDGILGIAGFITSILALGEQWRSAAT